NGRQLTRMIDLTVTPSAGRKYREESGDNKEIIVVCYRSQSRVREVDQQGNGAAVQIKHKSADATG
ncbi:MAG: hypothetical protein MJA30_34100, partial [Cytophagales bacterium]|nr:hypothetical protein [Cytophagales bacterium]